jgi:pyruvate dehydrogenase E2 component (dihydrolipoyllysine-residue acetyltransferase)
MANEVKLPRLGQGMEAGTVVKWLKSEGDHVEKGDPLYEVDTDKVTQEVESDFAGVLLKIGLSQGEAPVGRTIAWIGEPGEAISEAEPSPQNGAQTAETASGSGAARPGPEDAAAVASPETPTSASAQSAEAQRIKASPLARRIARERGVDLSRVHGTGPDGRIVAEDVERGETGPVPAAAPVPIGEIEVVPLSSIRRTIARRLTAAWEIPVFQLTVSADMTRANELVARARELNPDVRVTVTDLLVKVCAQALVRHREVNAEFADDGIRRHPSANVGIAVAAPQGLVVPVVPSAERLSLAEVAGRRTDLVGRAADNKLTTQDLEGGTFTISNLGMPQYGVEQFVAVINPPQAAILAVGATTDRVVAVDGAPAVRPIVTLTLTVDHRAVDGAQAAEFLRTVKQFLEEPALAL